MGRTKVLKIRLSLKGRPLKTYRFTKDKVVVGRSPDSDIFLDNPGVSRTHIVLERASNGSYRVEDQGSANGTFVNDEQIKSEILMADDIVRIGKFSLWIDYESDLRDEPRPDRLSASPQTFQGTTVLSTNELEEMLSQAKSRDREVARQQASMAVVDGGRPEGTPVRPVHALVIRVALATFVIGFMAGALAVWLMRS